MSGRKLLGPERQHVAAVVLRGMSTSTLAHRHEVWRCYANVIFRTHVCHIARRGRGVWLRP